MEPNFEAQNKINYSIILIIFFICILNIIIYVLLNNKINTNKNDIYILLKKNKYFSKNLKSLNDMNTSIIDTIIMNGNDTHIKMNDIHMKMNEINIKMIENVNLCSDIKVNVTKLNEFKNDLIKSKKNKKYLFDKLSSQLS